MPELYNTQLSANYNKVQTSTNLGGREIQFYTLYAFEDFYAGDPELSYEPSGSVGYNRLWSEPGSRYEQAVRGIQSVAELFFLGEPKQVGSEGTYTEEAFVFAVAIDTSIPAEPAYTNNIAYAVAQSLGHYDVNVVPMIAVGDIIETI